MKRAKLGAVLVAIVVLVASCVPGGKPQIGKAAPDFAMADTYSKEHKLADYRGRVVLVVFWATWCPPCMQEVPSLKRLQNKYGEKGLSVLGVSVDGRPEKVLPKFIADEKINYQVLVSNNKVEKAYGGISSIPTAFLIDREGILRASYLGYTAESRFARDIENLL